MRLCASFPGPGGCAGCEHLATAGSSRPRGWPRPAPRLALALERAIGGAGDPQVLHRLRHERHTETGGDEDHQGRGLRTSVRPRHEAGSLAGIEHGVVHDRAVVRGIGDERLVPARSPEPDALPSARGWVSGSATTSGSRRRSGPPPRVAHRRSEEADVEAAVDAAPPPGPGSASRRAGPARARGSSARSTGDDRGSSSYVADPVKPMRHPPHPPAATS